MPGQDLGAYAEYGFYGLMKLRKFRENYERAVLQLARRIVEIGERVAPSIGLPLDYSSLPSAFASSIDKPVIQVTVLAPRIGELPPSLDPYYYGRSPIEWTPFRDRKTNRPIADVLAEVVTSLGYEAEVRNFLDRSNRMLAVGQPEDPEIVLVDPWVLMLPDHHEALDELTRLQQPWKPILVLLNNPDHQLADDHAELLGEFTSRPNVWTIVSTEELRRLVPEAIGRIAGHVGARMPFVDPKTRWSL